MDQTIAPSIALPVRDLSSLEVRPTLAREKERWDALMREHHYLSFGWMAGESLRHVALLDGEWVALLGWGCAALKGTLRERFIGWTPEQKSRRLPYLANNVRYLVLPSARIRNLASKVLALSVRRLSSDWQRIHGHPLHMVETFVDPSRFAGTCYKAAGWTCLGQTSGFGYRTGAYHHHGQPKTVWVRFLSKEAREILCHPDDTPRLTGDPPMSVSLDALPLEGISGLWNRLATLPDPRKKQGIRHPQLIVLKIVIAGILTGCTNVKALGEWAAILAKDQSLLERLGCFYSPSRKRYVPPSWTTLHRTLATVDSLRFEQALTEWVLTFADPSEPIAVDGKTLRGSASPFTKAIHLMSAFLGFSGLVLAQRNVSEKTNEITAFEPLLSPLPLEGRTVTADAMHTQRDHARFLVEEKGAHFVMTVKDNQKSVLEALSSPEHQALLAPPPARGSGSSSSVAPSSGAFSP